VKHTLGGHYALKLQFGDGTFDELKNELKREEQKILRPAVMSPLLMLPTHIYYVDRGEKQSFQIVFVINKLL
jgi:hypothetical protein